MIVHIILITILFFLFWLPVLGNLNSLANIAGVRISPYGSWKVEKNSRSLCVYGLFGGKKDNEEKSDEPSKVEF